MATAVYPPQCTEDTLVAEALIAAPRSAVWAALADTARNTGALDPFMLESTLVSG